MMTFFAFYVAAICLCVASMFLGYRIGYTDGDADGWDDGYAHAGTDAEIQWALTVRGTAAHGQPDRQPLAELSLPNTDNLST